ncbi:hypothetical protein Taro_005823 [Colocasia esculenta]|uniref:VQ domain-containing protein n=1 Tax=Colocasia esculenta TaxID=4460 RepID=A0A843TTL0_COLES|nr:hypothetical protein [Colocasia esculenta]
MLAEGGKSTCRRVGVPQGDRPAPLMVHREYSRSIKKPPKPAIIYMVTPEIIHVHPSEFMSLVQRLTGLQPQDPSSSPPPSPPPPPPSTTATKHGQSSNFGDGAQVFDHEIYCPPEKVEGVIRVQPHDFPVMESTDTLPRRAQYSHHFTVKRSFVDFEKDSSCTTAAGGLRKEDTCSLVPAERWFFHGDYLVPGESPSALFSSSTRVVPPPGDYIDVFCEVLQDT